jgi:uncharacterized RDD family membrane protein YckC
MKNTLRARLIRASASALAVLVLFGALTSPGLEKATLPDAGTSNTNIASAGAVDATNAAAAEAMTNAPTKPAPAAESGGIRVSREAVVTIGGNAILKENETAEAVVAIGGNAIAKGQVRDAVVAVFGNVEVSGEVRDAVVAVMGNVKLLPGAKVRGEVVSVGGTVEKAEGAEVGGQIQEIDFGALGLPKPEWLKSWFKQCVLKLRPLAPSVGWVWAVAGVCFLIYLLVALAFPRPVQRCVDELTRRPATTFLIGLMTKMLIPVATLILLVTGIGVFIVPFLAAAVLFAGILGKVALLQYFGQQLGRLFSGGALVSPLVSLLIGAALLTVLYLVPVLGLLSLLITGMWALGAAVTALFGGMRREMPERPQPPPSVPPPAYVPVAPMSAGAAAPAAGIAAMPVGSPEGPTQGGATPPAFAVPPVAAATPAPAPEAWTLPRAGFWERMGAGFLDVVLVSILGGLVGGPPLGFLVALAYFAGMWAWKGTTIGGIVLKLKVVRLDGRPITFPVALVRGLAAAFSVIVFFLGFLWMAWDGDKQGWHDKIAGTVVVRLPQTQSLVCL